jgi:hypothetical protein
MNKNTTLIIHDILHFDTQHTDTRCWVLLCIVSYMLSVTFFIVTTSVMFLVWLSIVMRTYNIMSVVKLNVIMLNVIIQSVIEQSVIILSVVMLNAVALN